MKRILLDTDTGIDDAMAIALALLSPEMQIVGITTVSGNVEVDKCTRNALLTVETIRPEEPSPVARGEEHPLARPLFTAMEVHGQDGIGGITELTSQNELRKYPEPSIPPHPSTGPQLIVESARELGRELTIITLGPLTNIARAIEIDREAIRGVGKIIVMGGAFRVYGNTSLVAEFNTYVDPEAAQMTLDLGALLTIVPLDVTEQVRLTRNDLQEHLKAKPSMALEFVRDISAFYMDYHRDYDLFDGCFIHDPLTLGIAIDPSFVTTVETAVSVETNGRLTNGMTLAELRPHRLPKETNASVAVSVDAKRFIRFFLDRLAGR